MTAKGHGSRKTRRPRGRPPTVFIDDPLEARERGAYLWRAAWRKYERDLRGPQPGYARRPAQPIDEFEEDLVYVRYAGLIPWQAVRSIYVRTLAFAEWVLDHRAARGPQLGAALNVRLFRAVETVAAIRRARKLDAREPTPTEVRDTLAVLEGEITLLDTVKHRLHRLRPHLLAFREAQKAERRSGKARCAAANGEAETGEVAPAPTSFARLGPA